MVPGDPLGEREDLQHAGVLDRIEHVPAVAPPLPVEQTALELWRSADSKFSSVASMGVG